MDLYIQDNITFHTTLQNKARTFKLKGKCCFVEIIAGCMVQQMMSFLFQWIRIYTDIVGHSTQGMQYLLLFNWEKKLDIQSALHMFNCWQHGRHLMCGKKIHAKANGKNHRIFKHQFLCNNKQLITQCTELYKGPVPWWYLVTTGPWCYEVHL